MAPSEVQPRWLGYWTAFLVIAAPFLYFTSETLSLFFSQTLSLVVLGVLVEGELFHTGGKLSGWFFRICLFWLGVLGLSAIFSVDPSISIPFFLKICGLVLIAITIRYGINSHICFKSLFWCAGFAIIVHSASGLMEYFRGDPMPASWIDPGMREIIKSRAAGFFGDPNLLGCYLAALLPYCIAGYFSTTGEDFPKHTPGAPPVDGPTPTMGEVGRFRPDGEVFKDPPTWARPPEGGPLEEAFLLGAVFLGGFGLLATFSRGAYIAAIAGLFTFSISIRHSLDFSGRKRALAVIGVVLALIFFSGPYKYRLFSILMPSDMTLSQRALINSGIIKALPSIPPFGFGPHTFNQVYPRFRVVGGDYPLNAHNEILQTLMESGPISAGLLIALCLILICQVYLLMKSGCGVVSFYTDVEVGRFRQDGEVFNAPFYTDVEVGRRRHEGALQADPFPTDVDAGGPPHESALQANPWISAACAGSFVAIVVQNLSGFSARIFPIAILLAISVGGLLNSMARKPGTGNVTAGEGELPERIWLWKFCPRKGWMLFFGIFLVLSFKCFYVQYLLSDAQRALSEKQPDRAMISLARIEEIDDRVPLMHFLMAQTEAAKGNASASERSLSRAIEINPTEALYWVYQSRITVSKNLKQAFSSMEKAIELDPAAESFRLEYARLLASSGRFLEAGLQLEEALSFSPGEKFHDVYPVYREVEKFKQQLLDKFYPQDKH